MRREIIRPFAVWDRGLRSRVELTAGIVLSGYRVVRGQTEAEEPYCVEFDVSGRLYSCPLHTFLPRTRALDDAAAACADAAGADKTVALAI